MKNQFRERIEEILFEKYNDAYNNTEPGKNYPQWLSPDQVDWVLDTFDALANEKATDGTGFSRFDLERAYLAGCDKTDFEDWFRGFIDPCCDCKNTLGINPGQIMGRCALCNKRY